MRSATSTGLPQIADLIGGGIRVGGHVPAYFCLWDLAAVDLHGDGCDQPAGFCITPPFHFPGVGCELASHTLEMRTAWPN